MTVAAVQVAPSHDPLTRRDDRRQRRARDSNSCGPVVAATGAALVVLPEIDDDRFHDRASPAEELWDLVTEIPGRSSTRTPRWRAELGIHLVVGSYERGPERGHGLQRGGV